MHFVRPWASVATSARVSPDPLVDTQRTDHSFPRQPSRSGAYANNSWRQKMRLFVLWVFVGFLPVITLSETPIARDTLGGSCGFWGQIVGSAQLLEQGMQVELVARKADQTESATRPILFVS